METGDNRAAVPANRGAMTVHEFCSWATISVAQFYREMEAGRIRVRKIGRKSVVTITDAQAWMDALPVFPAKEAA